MLVVTSKIKKRNKDAGLSTGADAVRAMSAVVIKLCEKGVERAKADGRKTVMARDINPDLEMLLASQ